MAGYYYLVATLNEYSLSGDTKQLDFMSIRKDVLDHLSSRDAKTLKLVLSYWDIQNFLNVLDARPNQYSYIGNYSQEQIAELAQQYNDIIELRGKLPEELELLDEQEPKEYSVKPCELFVEVFSRFTKLRKNQKSIAVELLECYYDKLEKNNRIFLRKWGEFDRSVKNLAAAFEARRQGIEIANELIGHGEICDSIIANPKMEDFGLNEHQWVADIIRLLSNKDIIRKERGLDQLRWDKIDELTCFDYFNIDFILGYILKTTMITRWLQLDEKTGREMFDRLVGQITTPDLIIEEL